MGECALSKLSKSLRNELLDDWLIMNAQLMSIVSLNMFARITGKEMMKDRNFNHWIASFCMDDKNTLTQNATALCKLSTMLLDDEAKEQNGCLWGAFFKTATNIDVDDDDG